MACELYINKDVKNNKHMLKSDMEATMGDRIVIESLREEGDFSNPEKQTGFGHKGAGH